MPPDDNPTIKNLSRTQPPDPNPKGGSLDRDDDEQGSGVPEQSGVQPAPIRGEYGAQSAGEGYYAPDSREGGEWRDEGQGQTSGQYGGAGYQDGAPQASRDQTSGSLEYRNQQQAQPKPGSSPSREEPTRTSNPQQRDRDDNEESVDERGG